MTGNMNSFDVSAVFVKREDIRSHTNKVEFPELFS